MRHDHTEATLISPGLCTSGGVWGETKDNLRMCSGPHLQSERKEACDGDSTHAREHRSLRYADSCSEDRASILRFWLSRACKHM